jgi:CBS domain-containing protein
LLAEGEALNPEFVASIRAPEQSARDVMIKPVVTVGEETEINEIARLLTANSIKRVPVLCDGPERGGDQKPTDGQWREDRRLRRG